MDEVQEPPLKIAKTNASVFRPRFESLSEEAVFVLLKHARSTVVGAPNEIISQMVDMMKRFCWISYFLLGCVLGPNVAVLDLSSSHQGRSSEVV